MRVAKALPVAVALVALAGLAAAPPAYAQQNSFKFFVSLTSSDNGVTFEDVALDPVIARAGVAFRFGKRLERGLPGRGPRTGS